MSLSPMKKCITLIVGILVSTHIYAESYVFGGKAHFQGVLINQGCSVLIKNNAASNITTPDSPIEIIFSFCPVSIYDNLTIGLSEHNKPINEMFHTDIKVKSEFNINKELNINDLKQHRMVHKFIREIDRPKNYESLAKNSIGILFNPLPERPPTQASNLLISVFYP